MARHKFTPGPNSPGVCARDDRGAYCGFVRGNIRVHLLDVEQPGRVPRQHSPARVSPAAPTTSQAARSRADRGLTEKRTQILSYVGKVAHGATDDEIEVALGLGHGAVSGRTNALRRDGWLAYAVDPEGREIVRPVRSGGKAKVNVLTPAARITLQAARSAA